MYQLNTLFFKWLLFFYIGFLITGCKNKTEEEKLADSHTTAIKPLSSVTLGSELNENSGSIVWNDTLWLQSDSSEPVLYGVDPLTGRVIKKKKIPGLKMQDWESVAQDEDYIYLGDFGNNSNYRKNLRIFRLEKEALEHGAVKLDTIKFRYEDQVDYSYNEVFQTDYDCESMLVNEDHIYLFTKQWISKGTAVYVMPKKPGDYNAEKISEYPVEGLITEAFKFPDEQTVILTGYSNLMHPFFILLEGFDGNHFFSGKIRKIEVDLLFNQIETICQMHAYKCYVTSEKFLYRDPELHVYDFESYISN
ncbi:MAG: hypothetical protein JEZ14_05230 [Marinilabiliaceae bacterium]|nr:hypothetical protein [Marinilabiliaceae bacterium]